MLHSGDAGAAPQETILSCVAVCAQNTAVISSGCASCYRSLLSCSLLSCATQCTTDANSAACITCQNTSGCTGAFTTCSGLPSGGAASPDAGTDGPRDGGADGPRDTALEAPRVDTGTDVRVDAGVDSRIDGGVDVAIEAGIEVGLDATLDVGADGADGRVD